MQPCFATKETISLATSAQSVTIDRKRDKKYSPSTSITHSIKGVEICLIKQLENRLLKQSNSRAFNSACKVLSASIDLFTNVIDQQVISADFSQAIFDAVSHQQGFELHEAVKDCEEQLMSSISDRLKSSISKEFEPLHHLKGHDHRYTELMGKPFYHIGLHAEHYGATKNSLTYSSLDLFNTKCVALDHYCDSSVLKSLKSAIAATIDILTSASDGMTILDALSWTQVSQVNAVIPKKLTKRINDFIAVAQVDNLKAAQILSSEIINAPSVGDELCEYLADYGHCEENFLKEIKKDKSGDFLKKKADEDEINNLVGSSSSWLSDFQLYVKIYQGFITDRDLHVKLFSTPHLIIESIQEIEHPVADVIRVIINWINSKSNIVKCSQLNEYFELEDQNIAGSGLLICPISAENDFINDVDELINPLYQDFQNAGEDEEVYTIKTENPLWLDALSERVTATSFLLYLCSAVNDFSNKRGRPNLLQL